MARVVRIALALLLLATAGAALAMPQAIPFIIGALYAAEAITLTTAFLLTAGSGLLVAADARRRQRKAASAARSAYNASLQDRNVTVLSNEVGWRIVYGNPAPVGGALVALHTSGDRDQYKHLAIVFAAHECEAIDEVYIEGEPLGALDGAGWVTGGAFFESGADQVISEVVVLNGAGVGTVSHPVGSLVWVEGWLGGDGDSQQAYPVSYPATASGTTITVPALATGGSEAVTVSYSYSYGTARVNLQKHTSPGGVDTVDAFLQQQVPDKWTNAHKLTGYTYIVLTLDLNFGRFQGGPPNVTARIRGKKLYDPRTGATVYSRNAALAVADLLMAPWGMGAGLAQIDTAALIAAANACDAQGFACDGRVDVENGREANLQALEDAMAGSTHYSGGVWRVMAGAWASPVLSLTDAHMAAPIEVMQASHPREKRYNGARVRFVPAAGLGVSQDMTPYTVASYLAADGAEQALDMALPFTATAQQCGKLAAIAVEQGRLGLTIRYPAHLAAWKLQPGDRVSVTNSEFGFAAKTFRVVDWDFRPDAPVGLVLTEDLAAVWTGTYNPLDLQLATSQLYDPWARPVPPAGLTAASGTGVLLRQSDGTIITRVLVSWAGATSRVVLQGGYTQLQWRRIGVLPAQWQSMDLPADATSVYLGSIDDGASILIRVRHITGLQVFGYWANLAHLVLGKTEPPAAPAYVTATQTMIFWAPVAELDLAGYRIRAWPGATGAVWSQARELHSDLITASPWLIVGRLYGVQTILVAAEDTSGNVGAPASAVLDFGAPDTSSTVATRDWVAEGYPVDVTSFTAFSAGHHAGYSPGNEIFCGRTTGASFVGADGLLQTAAARTPRYEYHSVTRAYLGLLVEAAGTNLARQSQTFQTSWTRTRSNVAVDAAVAPDGTMTADTFYDDSTASNTHIVTQNTADAITPGLSYCWSVYVKAGPGARRLRVRAGDSVGFLGDVVFDPAAGVFTVTSTQPYGSQVLPGGWYRIWIAAPANVGATFLQHQMGLYSGSSGTYSGDGVSGVYLWGAQLEPGSSPSSYIVTTTAAAPREADDCLTADLAAGTFPDYTAANVVACARSTQASYVDSAGLLQLAPAGQARLSYDPGTLAYAGLLVERQATNELPRSQAFNLAPFSSTRASVTPDAATAPDGTTTAARLTEDATASSTHFVQSQFTPAGGVIGGATYCWSIFAKADSGGRTLRLRAGDTVGFLDDVVINLATGAVLNSAPAVGVQSLPAGWWRVWFALPCNAAATQLQFGAYLADPGGAATYTGDGSGSALIWGGQVERGGEPTSYVPTGAAAATRAADAVTASSPQLGWERAGGQLAAATDAASNAYGLFNVYAQADLYATYFRPIVWQAATYLSPYSGTLALQTTFSGGAASVEYRVSGAVADLYALADLYAASEVFGSEGAWSVWPGALEVRRGQPVDLRVSIEGGSTQAAVERFLASLVLPPVRQTFGSVVVGEEGVRLAPAAGTPPRTWIEVRTAQVTPVVDGGGAIAGRVLDFSPTLGPLIQLIDASGTAVAGRATVDIGGIADE